jgi:D-alanyl-D-alanine carboxypeptidase/D-alanyl-D-alanine-endopeptidase (penicillin-binding protein 4)
MASLVFAIATSAAPVPADALPRQTTRATKQPKRSTSTRSTKARPKRVVRAPVIPALRFTTPRNAVALSSDLATLLGSRTRNGQWGAMVVSLTRGDTLFAQSPDERLVPASTMKLFTSAIALERLGPDHTYSTDVLRDGALEAGWCGAR